MANRYAQLDVTNTVTNILLVGDDVATPEAYLQNLLKTPDQFIAVPGNSAAVGTGFTWDDPTFVGIKPYSTWVESTDNNVTIWISPVPIPTTITHDQPAPSDTPPTSQAALEVFEWDNPNTRWLNGEGQYWDAAGSTWVDV